MDPALRSQYETRWLGNVEDETLRLYGDAEGGKHAPLKQEEHIRGNEPYWMSATSVTALNYEVIDCSGPSLDGHNDDKVKLRHEPNGVSTKSSAALDREAPANELEGSDCFLSSDALEFLGLMKHLGPILAQYISECQRNEKPIVHQSSHSPQELLAYMGDLLKLPDEPAPTQLFPLIHKCLECSVRTWSPRFMDKLYAGARPIGVVSELIIGVLNTNVHVFHVSPVLTVMEKNLISRLGRLMGYESGQGGFLCPGGSFSNLHALVTARNYFFPSFIAHGMQADSVVSAPSSPYKYIDHRGPLQAFSSHHAHYSMTHACLTMGLGSKNIVLVAGDPQGRIIPSELRKAIRESIVKGNRPFFIHLTAGTTVLGAFDPIYECCQIAKEYGLWVHLDASWGGGIAFSKSRLQRKLLRGSELCDSITWNLHKLMGIPLLCSAFLVKKGSIVGLNSLKAEYLYHEDEEYPDMELGSDRKEFGFKPWDLGDGTIGCGRRGDSLKLYLTWVLEGSKGFSNRIDSALTRARLLYGYINSAPASLSLRGSFYPLMEPEFINVCFWYLPPMENWPQAKAYRDKNPQKFKTCLDVAKHLRINEFPVFYTEMEQITKQVHKNVTNRSNFMVDYAPLSEGDNGRSLPIFWRVVMINPNLTDDDIKALIMEIDQVGIGIVL